MKCLERRRDGGRCGISEPKNQMTLQREMEIGSGITLKLTDMSVNDVFDAEADGVTGERQVTIRPSWGEGGALVHSHQPPRHHTLSTTSTAYNSLAPTTSFFPWTPSPFSLPFPDQGSPLLPRTVPMSSPPLILSSAGRTHPHPQNFFLIHVNFM